jgi:peptidoglycan/LPS O-acetylase OafA/YrhL
MRLLAAMSVIYGHASVITGDGIPDIFLEFVGYKFIGGVAVDVFFVLSGFLICASVMNGKGVRYYLVSRFLRIFPALIVCVGISVLVLGPLLSKGEGYWGAQVWNYFLYNATAFRTEYFLPGVFENLNDHAVNGSLWSLPVEVRLYGFVLFIYLTGLLSSRVAFNFVFFAALICLYFSPAVFYPALLYDTHLHVAGMFLVGVFYWINRDSLPINPWIVLVLLMVAGLFHGTPKFGIAYAVVLPYLVFFLAFVGSSNWVKRLGDYSYGIYLYGWPVQQVMELSFPGRGSYFNALISVIVATALGAISWYWIERPGMRLRNRLLSVSMRVGEGAKVRSNA